MGDGQAKLPIAVILNVAEHSPKSGSGLLIGDETGVLVEHLLWFHISRTAHLTERIDIEGFDREKDGVPDQSIQTYAVCGINQSPDVARFGRGLPFRFHVIGPNEAIVSLIHQEIGPAKHTLNTSHPQYLNVLCGWIQLWLDPRCGVARQGKRAVVIVQRKRHAAMGPSKFGAAATARDSLISCCQKRRLRVGGKPSHSATAHRFTMDFASGACCFTTCCTLRQNASRSSEVLRPSGSPPGSPGRRMKRSAFRREETACRRYVNLSCSLALSRGLKAPRYPDLSGPLHCSIPASRTIPTRRPLSWARLIARDISL